MSCVSPEAIDERSRSLATGALYRRNWGFRAEVLISVGNEPIIGDLSEDGGTRFSRHDDPDRVGYHGSPPIRHALSPASFFCISYNSLLLARTHRLREKNSLALFLFLSLSLFLLLAFYFV